MNIRPAEARDIPELMELVHSAYRGEGSKRGWTTEADLLDGSRTTPELLKSQIEADGSAILIYVDTEEFSTGRIIGCVQVEVTKKYAELKCYVGLLTVSPELQARGIGKKLLVATHDWAREKNCVALIMTVITARDSLIAWYKRHGFEDTGEKQPFFADPIYGIPKQEIEFVVLEKRL